MKKITLLSVATLLIFSAFTNKPEPAKDILGKWKIHEASLQSATKSVINATRKANPERAQQMEDHFDAIMELISGIEITYQADNTYNVSMPQQPVQSGKWELTDGGHSILVTPQGRPARKDSILEITSTQLRIINRERGDTTLYVHP